MGVSQEDLPQVTWPLVAGGPGRPALPLPLHKTQAGERRSQRRYEAETQTRRVGLRAECIRVNTAQYRIPADVLTPGTQRRPDLNLSHSGALRHYIRGQSGRTK
jgi:hypothetical protein